MLIDVAFSGDRNVTKKEAKKTLSFKDLTTEIKCIWNVKTRQGQLDHLKIIRKIPKEHIGKAINQGNTESSHIVSCTHTHTHTHTHITGSTNKVKVQNTHREK